ncbi:MULTISPECIES: YqkE family protein [Cytobacillus]|uniref:YqkE family protein n=1 Tax=Cytobacillus stercorigallinarum TaxID=2762240 RepID=A0ABR8QKE3_9BACI|nr:YqkE family protein [Cytobacillus stercorigallinarum]MBD7935985.1 YqkE family protein [Cytobacillus stercorigallinarum]
MKQKKQRAQSKKINEDKPLTLGDMLNPELVKGLQGKKNELKKAEEIKLEEESRRKAEERKLREKNKSFEELLGESNLNWKEFK